MKAVILAGGKGTRLGLNDTPKPMAPIAGMPLLEHQIVFLKKNGINEIILLTGYLSKKIENYFKDGKAWNVSISYIEEQYALGTAGAIRQLMGRINDRFLVLYGDVVLDFDVESFIDFDKKSDSIASIITHPNDHPYDSDLVEIDSRGVVTNFISKPHPADFYYKNMVNAAVYMLDPAIFKYINQGESSDFGKDVFPAIVKEGKHIIRAYQSPEYIKDMGTPDRLQKTEQDLISGKVASYNKKNKRAAIFIDRDGVINKEVDNLCDIDKFELLDHVPEAIKNINSSRYLTIVITNQPVIAKGFLTEKQLEEIHKKLETSLGNSRAYVDKIYFCPHHPDKGYEGEIESLKIDCSCRKPNIGMIELAVQEFNIDLSKSFMIGDSTTDILTAKNAGIKSILVKTGHAGRDNKYKCLPDLEADNLLDAVNIILKNNGN